MGPIMSDPQSELLLVALESASTGVLIVRPNGHIEWVNSAFARENGSPFGLRWENCCHVGDQVTEMLAPELTSLVEVAA